MVKNDVFLSMHYLTFATLFDHSLPVYTCEMFGLAFTGMIHLLRKFTLTLSEKYSLSDENKKRVAKFVYFLEGTMCECLII